MLALDTNTVSHYFRGDPAVVPRLQALPPSQVALPSVVLYELRYGLMRGAAVEACTSLPQPPRNFLRLPRPKPLLRVAGNQLWARLGKLEYRIVQSPPVGQRSVAVEPSLDLVESSPASDMGRPRGAHHVLRQTGGQFLKYPNGSGVLGHQVDDVRGGSGDSNPASSIQSQQAHLRSKSRAALTIGLAQPGVRRKSCSASG